MSKRSRGTNSVSISVAVKEENYSRLGRMMRAGFNRSEIVDKALTAHFRRKDADGSLGSFAMNLDHEERFKMMLILASSMRSQDESEDGTSSRSMLIDTLVMCIQTLKNEMLK
tara:strand:- start:2154 stop:2492 length:339 start_codon:yes stop_codon:yes gene_type:complete